ncbi:MAG TPA: hypothetical protein VLQ93_10320, partial [Myxococcaceae bacterium]|nr:hypothetical protein [Myxococcaceae bacterium]
SFRFDEERFLLVEQVEEQPSILHLHNVHAEYEDAPLEVREEVLQRFARSMLPCRLPTTWPEAAPVIRARVSDRGTFELGALRARARNIPFPSQPYIPLAEHLALALVIDLPDTIASVSWEECERWKVSRAQALEVAVENLARVSREDFERQGALFVSPWGDNYDAARLVLIEKLAELPVKGRLVALLPHRDHLLLTGSEDAEGLAQLADRCEELASGPRYMGFFPVVLEDGTWRPFRPVEGHPASERYRWLALQERARLYRLQKELLIELHQRTGEQVSVADFEVLRVGGLMLSHCTWSRTAPTLLPRADVVLLGEPDASGEEPLEVPWEVLQQHAGHLLVPEEELYPERYRVTAFPSPELLEVLRSSQPRSGERKGEILL